MSPGFPLINRLVLALVLGLSVLAGSWFYSYAQSAQADLQQARRAQCAVAYELVLRQLLERAELPGGQVSAALLTQLQILESQPCVTTSLRAELLPRGGSEQLLPMASAASTEDGLRAFVGTGFGLLAEIGRQSTAGDDADGRLARMQARYREAMPLLGRLEQGALPELGPPLRKHIEAVRRDFGAGADSDRFERARLAYLGALQALVEALDRDVERLPLLARQARNRLSSFYDAAIVARNALLQARVSARQLDRRLALAALAVLVAMLLLAGGLLAAALERDRRRRLKDLVQATHRTAQGELGLAVEARGGDKVAELQRAFNGMTADLSRRYQNIIDELEAALAAAKAAERAKSDFLRNVSHEIRTPMNAILGLSHLALETSLDRRQKDYVGTIQQEANTLITLINDILDFSKMESGELVAAAVEFDLLDLLDPLLQSVRERARAKGLGFETALAPELPRALVGDPQRLAQILGHYAANALKFTEQGSIRFELSLLRQSPERVELRFAFIDTGIGIGGAQMSDLFQSIRQGDATATRKYGGTGLGLVLSRQLATLMGGEVGAESQPGRGSSFWLRIAFRPAKPLLARPQMTPDPGGALAATASSTSTAGNWPAFDAALLQTIREQIESCDTMASETVGELLELLGDAAPPVLRQIEQHIGNFDFDAAAPLMPALRAALTPPPGG